MADLSIYELEDIIWDEFERSGDHIVPRPTEDHGSEDKYEGDSCKKPRLEVNSSGNDFQFKEERESKTLNKQEDDSCSHIPDGVFTASGDADSSKDALSLQSGDTKLSNYSFNSSIVNSGSELCRDEGMLKVTSGMVDRSSYNDLNLFSNDHDDNESSDLLYFGWPDIENFEDVDKILSNCDSSLAICDTGNEDELLWLTSEDPGGGYLEALKMDLKFPCSEPSALSNVSQDHEPREFDNKASSFVSESKLELNLKDQKSRQQNHSEGTKAGSCLKTYGLKSNDIQLSSSEISDKPFTLIGNWQQNKYSGHDSVGYMQSNAYLHSGNNQVPSQKQFQMLDNKIECQRDMEGVKKGASADLGLLEVPEASSISSELDEFSPLATAFRQLQQVMLQLDVKTKLCIRDSLYRLARSAEQRHNHAGISDSTANHGRSGAPLMTEGARKYTGLMDMETDTNPIDRTVAHLLFHRPSDSSNMSTPPIKLNTKVHGSMIGPPMVAEKPRCQQTEGESDDKISSTRQN